jgi:HB1, ASXL, restriction endonuclease HTH domain
MAAKKHSKRIASDKTTQAHQTTDATDQTVPDETPAPAEPVAVETAEAASVPTAQTLGINMPLSTQAENRAPDPTVLNQPTPVKSLSALDAAAKVLGETGQAMTCTELIVAMAAQGYWSSPKGRTPAGTLYSAVLRELKTKGDQARFRKTERGKFALRVTE